MATRFLVAGLLLVSIAGVVQAEEKVENPLYANWSKFKLGASVTVKSTTVRLDDGNPTIVTKTTKLIKIGNDKVVIDVEYISEGTDRAAFKTKPKSEEILKVVPLPTGVKAEEFEKKLPWTIDEGKELLKVAPNEFATTWYKTKRDTKDVKREGKTWLCDDLPGRIVKEESTTNRAGSSSTTKVELVKFHIP